MPKVATTVQSDCYESTQMTETQIFPLYDGRFVVNPKETEICEMKCQQGNFAHPISELTMITIPLKCIAVVAHRIFTSGSKSPITEIPQDWTQQAKTDQKTQLDSIKPLNPQLHDPEPDDKPSIFKGPQVIHIQTPREPKESPELSTWEKITTWIENTTTNSITGIVLGTTAAVLQFDNCKELTYVPY